MPNHNPLTNKHLKRINDDMRDIGLIKEDIDHAAAAGVPHTEQLHQACDECLQKMEALKKVYFPNHK
jgi:hypothetical protein